MTPTGVPGDIMTEDWRTLNRAHWDERVPIHRDGGFYDVEGFKAGRTTLKPAEVRDLAPVAGRRLVHLQCHFGLDTLSWARLGAEVTGLDFSAEAVAAARALAAEIGVAARFVEADLYDAPGALGLRYDIVYTGIGALMWLPDIARWARVVAQLLVPGGELYLNEFHPVQWMLSDDDPLRLRDDYFTPPEGFRNLEQGTYADRRAPTRRNETLQWNHPLGEVVTALIRAGLTIRELREEDSSVLQRWPVLVRGSDGRWRMPSQPMMYTLRARL